MGRVGLCPSRRRPPRGPRRRCLLSSMASESNGKVPRLVRGLCASALEKQQKWRRESPNGLTELGGYSASVSSSTIGPCRSGKTLINHHGSITLRTGPLLVRCSLTMLNSAPSMDLLRLSGPRAASFGWPGVGAPPLGPARGPQASLRVSVDLPGRVTNLNLNLT